jgi:HK97 family phage portal protein
MSDLFALSLPDANWSSWTVRRSVSEGYKVSGWVYRAVSLIARNASSVPWVVYNPENEIEWDHPLTKLFAKPNPQISRQKFMELLIAWMELAGNGYAKQVFSGGRTVELWPISPDRIAPIPSKDPGLFISGYQIEDANGHRHQSEDYTPENVIHFLFMNPSNPLEGISPLQAAARAVDLDNAQQDWNVSAMQNRGVVDGVFTFDTSLDSAQADSIMKRIKDKFSGAKNARSPLVIGSKAKYQRLALTPVELDFLQSRKFNMEEIFIIYGVPPQLAGAQESSTYNNFSTSMRIFWEGTLVPLLDNLKDTLNHRFYEELSDGYTIGYDTSNIAALRSSEKERADTAKVFADIGIPMSQINEKLELGFDEWDGWDAPWSGARLTPMTERDPEEIEEEEEEERGYRLIPDELRSPETEAKRRDAIAEGPTRDMFARLLSEQRDAVFTAMDAGGSVEEALRETREDWLLNMTQTTEAVAVDFAGTVVVDQRGNPVNFETRETNPAILAAIESYFPIEETMLTELSLIESTTVKKIVTQVAEGQAAGKAIGDIQQAILDTGAFSDERALRLARTIVGTASSVGQLAGAASAGATMKTWNTSGFEVREEHVNRDGETVAMDKTFSTQVGSVPPRFPLDPAIDPGDRVNCRCWMTFSA